MSGQPPFPCRCTATPWILGFHHAPVNGVSPVTAVRDVGDLYGAQPQEPTEEPGGAWERARGRVEAVVPIESRIGARRQENRSASVSSEPHRLRNCY